MGGSQVLSIILVDKIINPVCFIGASVQHFEEI